MNGLHPGSSIITARILICILSSENQFNLTFERIPAELVLN